MFTIKSLFENNNKRFILSILCIFILNKSFSQTKEDIKLIIKQYDTNKINLLLTSLKNEQKNREAKIKEANFPKQFIIDNKLSFLYNIDENGHPLYLSDFNNGATLTTRARKLWSGGSLGLNVQGQNMTVGIWEVGSTLISHSHFQGRAVQSDNSTSTLSDHANHVLGTMIQNKTTAPTSKGMAFNANAKCYDANNGSVEQVNEASTNGLLVSNHSYGFYFNNPTSGSAQIAPSQAGKYNSTAYEVDNILYTLPYYMSVWAAGNERESSGAITNKGGYDMLNSYTCAKNNIVVGAVNAVPIYSSPSDVIMSSFSCWGPTDDGRIKPDLVAKGVDVVSCTSTSTTATGTMSGTSMAAPGVTGTLLLLQQHYNNVKGNFMKSSTLKGLALHTADEAGASNGPDYSYGWGLINAEKAASLISDNINNFILESTLNNNQTIKYYLTVPNTSSPLIASISWTDPPGNINTGTIDDSTPALMNDLDIKLINLSNNTISYPWKLSVSNPSLPATTGDNSVDPFEKIEINSPSNQYLLEITHKSNLVNNSQNFSLIISNANNVTLNTVNNNFDKSIFVYPNPTSSILNFNITENIELLSISISDISGKNVMQIPYSDSIQNKINLENLQSGVYFVKFTTKDNVSVVKKIVKE